MVVLAKSSRVNSWVGERVRGLDGRPRTFANQLAKLATQLSHQGDDHAKSSRHEQSHTGLSLNLLDHLRNTNPGCTPS
jgi:hypothetical protein